MFDHAFQALIQNTALLLAMAFVYDLTTSRYRLKKPNLPGQLSVGVSLGGLSIVIMLSSWHYVTGIVFDTRSVLLGVAGLFFGVLPTAVAMAMAAAYRLFLGGAAAWTGVAVILASGTLGLLWGHYRRQATKDFSWRELYLFGVLVHAVMLALMFTLPMPTALQVLSQISLPVLLIYPVATALLGSLMVNRLQRDDFSLQLQASEERLRLALMAANQGLYDLNVQTGEAQVNPEYAAMLGYDPAEFQETNAKWIERLHPDDHEPVATAYRDYIAGKIPEYRVEFRQRTKAGEWKWILSLGRVVEYDAVGRPLRMLGTHTDINERKQIEDALRKSEQRFRSLLEDVPNIAMQGYDRERRVVFWNTASEKLYGFTREEALGRQLEDLIIPPEMRQGVIAAVNNWVTQGIPIPAGELLLQGKDGRPVNVFSSHVMQDIHGEAEMYCMDIDLTERKQAEEALRKNEIFIRTVLDNLPIGISVNSVGPAVQFAYMNDNFPRLYRTTREALATPDAFWEAVYEDPAFREVIKNRVLEACASGDPAQMQWEDVPISRKGEETRYIVAKNTPIPGQQLMISIVWDVTERKRNEAEKEKLQAQLLQAQKMESSGGWPAGWPTTSTTCSRRFSDTAELALGRLKPNNPAS